MQSHGLCCVFGLIGAVLLAGCSTARPADAVRSEVAALVVPFSGPGQQEVPFVIPRHLTDAERSLLLSVLVSERSIDEVQFLPVLATLVADGHPDTVKRLCELLHEQENRYFALALGAIGDASAIPALRRRCRTTRYGYVEDDCRLALQLLGDRSSLDRLPDPTGPVHSPLQISATIDRGTVAEGQPFSVVLTFRNGGVAPIRYFKPIYSLSRCVSADGDHLIAMQGSHIFYEVDEDYFLTLHPGEEFRFTEWYEVVRRPMSVGRPFFRWIVLPGEVLCLMQTNGMHQGRRLAVYEPGRRIALRLAYVYDGGDYRHDAERLGIEHAVMGRVVSNAVGVTVVADGDGGNR